MGRIRPFSVNAELVVFCCALVLCIKTHIHMYCVPCIPGRDHALCCIFRLDERGLRAQRCGIRANACNAERVNVPKWSTLKPLHLVFIAPDLVCLASSPRTNRGSFGCSVATPYDSGHRGHYGKSVFPSSFPCMRRCQLLSSFLTSTISPSLDAGLTPGRAPPSSDR